MHNIGTCQRRKEILWEEYERKSKEMTEKFREVKRRFIKRWIEGGKKKNKKREKCEMNHERKVKMCRGAWEKILQVF